MEIESLGVETLQDFDSASHAARHLTLGLFDPIESRVQADQRQVVETVRSEFLRLLLNRLRRAADAGFPPMRDILEQTARVDLLGSPFGSATELSESTRQAYREAVAELQEKSRIRHLQAEVLNQLLKDPDAFAADSEATHFSLPALDTEGRPVDAEIHEDEDDEAEEEIFEAELADDADDSAFGDIAAQDVEGAAGAEPIPASEASLDLDQETAAAAAAAKRPAGMSELNAKRLKVGERLIRNTSAILFDLIRQHCDEDYEAAVHSVEVAFMRTCIDRLREAIIKGEDAKLILKQLMAINPVRIRVAALGDIEASVGMQFREAVFQLETSRTYANQLQNARKVFAKYPNSLLGDDAPTTYAGAVRLLANAESAPSAPDSSKTLVKSKTESAHGGPSRKAKSGEAAVEISNHGGVIIIKLRNSSYMSQSEIRRLEGELSALIRNAEKPRVAINFSRVERISSAFIGVIFALNKLTRTQKGQLRIAELREPVQQVFELTGVPKLIKTHKTTADAVSAMI